MLPFLREKENKYLPTRTKIFKYLLENNPCKYHKKKNCFSSGYYDSDLNGKNSNQELLLFQKENERNINLFHNYIKFKSQFIEKSKNNYLNFIKNEKEKKYKINNIRTLNNSKSLSLSLFSNDQKNDSNINSNYYNDFSKNVNKYSYRLPKYGRYKRSDITNPNYFDNIIKTLVLKKNTNILNYNKNIYKRKYPKRNYLSFDNELPLPPGRINNLKYYNLGESKLKSNPIVSPGNHFFSPYFIENYNKKKSEFIS